MSSAYLKDDNSFGWAGHSIVCFKQVVPLMRAEVTERSAAQRNL